MVMSCSSCFGQPPKEGNLMFEIIAAIKHCLMPAAADLLSETKTGYQANAVQCVFACFGLMIVYCEMLGCEVNQPETLES